MNSLSLTKKLLKNESPIQGGIQVGDKVVYHLDREITGKGWVMTKDCEWRLKTSDFATRTPNWDNAFLSRGKAYCGLEFRGYAFNLIQWAGDNSFKLYKIPKKHRIELKRGRNVILSYNLHELWKDGISNRRVTGNEQYKLRKLYETFVGHVPTGRTVQKIQRGKPANACNVRLNGQGVSKTVFGWTLYKKRNPIEHFYTETEANERWRILSLK